MNEVRINRRKLIEILVENRKLHNEEWNATMEVFTIEAKKAINNAFEEVANGTWSGRLHVARPPNHSEDYDRVIRMLELSEDDVVTLNEVHFRQFVLDEWNWKEAFTNVVKSYNVRA